MMSETVIVVHFIFKMSDFALLIKNSLLGLVLHNVTLECSLCSCNIFESASRKYCTHTLRLVQDLKHKGTLDVWT